MSCSSAPAIRRAASWLNVPSIAGQRTVQGLQCQQPSQRYGHPLALALLNELGYDTSALRSKSWDDFAGGPRFDFVFTVCDQAVAEPCPVWPGQPFTAHWGLADPAAFKGTEDEQRRCFARTYGELEARIKAFVNLDIERMDPSTLQKQVDEIGCMTLAEAREQ